MRGRRTDGSLRLVAAVALGALLSLALAPAAFAQQVQASAELKRVIGRVEILRKGQTQWIPAVIGARLVEGDDIRSYPGAQAELELPDTSTVLLVENSRLLITKIEYDRQNQSRLVLLHLVVGKVRAAIAQTAMTLVRARQSNFAISTPTGVAAARGTVLWVISFPDPLAPNGTRMMAAVEPQQGLRFQPRIECITVATPQPRRQMVFAGYATTDCGPTVTATQQMMSPSNTLTAGTALLNAPVVAPPFNALQLEQLITSVSVPTSSVAQTNFNTASPSTDPGPPSSFGVNQVVNEAQAAPSTPQQSTNFAPPPPSQ